MVATENDRVYTTTREGAYGRSHKHGQGGVPRKQREQPDANTVSSRSTLPSQGLANAPTAGYTIRAGHRHPERHPWALVPATQCYWAPFE